MPFLVLAFVALHAVTHPVSLRRPAVKTPIVPARIAAVLSSAHRDVMGYLPTAARLSMLVAIVRLEKPGAAYNLGSYHAVRGQSYTRCGSGRLRAFASHKGAAVALLDLLRARCSMALRIMDGGDPMATSEALRRCWYHRSQARAYAAGLRGLLRR